MGGDMPLGTKNATHKGFIHMRAEQAFESTLNFLDFLGLGHQ